MKTLFYPVINFADILPAIGTSVFLLLGAALITSIIIFTSSRGFHF